MKLKFSSGSEEPFFNFICFDCEGYRYYFSIENIDGYLTEESWKYIREYFDNKYDTEMGWNDTEDVLKETTYINYKKLVI